MGLGAGGLDAVRSLGKQGIKVYGIFTSGEEPGRFSRYCKPLAFPPLKSDPNSFLKKIIDFAKNLKISAVLLPVHDEYITFMCKYREILLKFFLFQIPDGNFIEKLVNKDFMAQLAVTHGLPIPKTVLCDHNKAINHIAEEMNYPCIIKPLNSFSIPFPGKNIIINDYQSFIDTFKTHPEYVGNTLAQEIIEGGDDSLCQFQAYLDGESRPLAIRTARKIRQYPPNTGGGSYMVTEELPEVRKLSLSFLKSINYKGFAGLEFKMDPKTGKFFFVEINTRIPWGHALCSDCGNSLALAAYLALTGRSIKIISTPDQINGMRWIDFRMDLGSFVHKFLIKEITFREWIISVFKANSFAYWDCKDPLPFFYSLWMHCKTLVRQFSRYLRTKKLVKSQPRR